MKTQRLSLLCLLCIVLWTTMETNAQNTRERILIDNNWLFSLGHATNMAKDYGHGTEYFTYIAKVQATLQTKSPIWTGFDDSSWQKINLPHDWVVDLPYSKDASHSHGYKTIGWKYPDKSVGWYRKHLFIPKSDSGRNISIEFEGIYRNAQVFCNGFFLGTEPSGYATQIYNITDYLNYGGDNVITVRADASLEEGWFYEGAGIYRHTYLNKTNRIHVASFGTFVTTALSGNKARINVSTTITNDDSEKASITIKQIIYNMEGKQISSATSSPLLLSSRQNHSVEQVLSVDSPIYWNLDNPYRYFLYTEIYKENRLIDSYPTRFGIRDIKFDASRGFLLNGKSIKLKGTNLHQDHAGVGTAIPDELWAYRIKRLKDMGSNAIRCSHNPASPTMLDLCDSLGMLVIDENRSMGINEAQIGLLKRMIERDRNHPSIILWSIGNEEWAIEGNDAGRRIAYTMSEYVHRIDSTRPTTAGNAGGRILIEGLDVQGYNYIAQNDIDGLHSTHPDWKGVGTEETSGCGTRNVYYTDSIRGWMAPINREYKNKIINIIERGWKYYLERPWLGGLFYWTGFDYRGEPNPMVYPATGSQFGIFDYCGFPKDEAYYLQACWTDKPVLHLSPHWNLKIHEGDSIKVWAYSNCDEIELYQDGKSLGRKIMPSCGHLEWMVPYRNGKLLAQGYKNGKKDIVEISETTGKATAIKIQASKLRLKGNGRDISIIDLSMIDNKNREVPDAMNKMKITLNGPAIILGYGNGDPGFKGVERPEGVDKQTLNIEAFCGKAQVIIRSSDNSSGKITLTISGEGIRTFQTILYVE